MAPAYKFYYFDARGAGESCRFLFKYGGIEFEDIRIQREKWPQLKDTSPFGQLPYLEHNGKVVNQTAAINRYLAKQVGLAGKNDWENLEIDAIVDTLTDLRLKLAGAAHVSDQEKKKALLQSIGNETLPFYFGKIETIAKKNNGYLAAGRLTWADLHFVSGLPSFELLLGGSILEKYPTLRALVDKVKAIPSIKKWIEIRPQTEF